jgi:benzoyl-CoA reductase/2-hydroxyglutaryl-CoA dehydratase subunit BcrC/BadD/HgdB
VQLGAHVAALESCTSPDRWKSLSASTLAPSSARDAGDVDYEALAATALEAGLCPRRSTTDRRAHLQRRLEESAPSSIIYARQSFCDPGAYDALLVAELARERGLPYLEIEVDFPFDASGPLRTRVEAFLEAQLLDDDLLTGEHGAVRVPVAAAAECGDCPGAQAEKPRIAVPDDDLPDDLFNEEG